MVIVVGSVGAIMGVAKRLVEFCLLLTRRIENRFEPFCVRSATFSQTIKREWMERR